MGQLEEELKRAQSGRKRSADGTDLNGTEGPGGSSRKRSAGLGLNDGKRWRHASASLAGSPKGKQREGFGDLGGLGAEGVEGFGDGDFHFEAEDSADEGEHGFRSEAGPDGTSLAKEARARGGEVSDVPNPAAESSEDEAEVFPTSFRFAAEEDGEDGTAERGPKQRNGTEPAERGPEQRNGTALDEVDPNASELDGMRIRRGAGSLPGASQEEKTGDDLRTGGGIGSGSYFRSEVGRKRAESSLVATIRKNIHETKKPRFGYKPSREGMPGTGAPVGRASVPEKRLNPPQVSPRVKAPTTSFFSNDESGDTGGVSSGGCGWKGRGAPESQMSGERGTSVRSLLTNSKPVGGLRGYSEQGFDRQARATVKEVDAKHTIGSRCMQVTQKDLGRAKPSNAGRGILGGSVMPSAHRTGSSLFNRLPAKRSTPKVTDFFAKK